VSGEKIPSWTWWLVGACGLGLATSAWILLVRVPQLGREVAAIRAERAALQARGQTGQAKADPVSAGAAEPIEANVPAVRLQPGSSTPGVLTVSGAPRRIVVWLEGADPSSGGGLDVQTADGRMIMQVGNLRSNEQGGFVVALPTAKMPPGSYQLRLFSISRGTGAKTVSYLLTIRVG
jgi:hypothetical protein